MKPPTILSYRGNVFTELLPRDERKGTHIDTQTDGSDLYSTSSRWVHLPRFTCEVFINLFQELKR
jgi:hypothetical protein